MNLDFRGDALVAYNSAAPATKAAAASILEFLSTGFQISWFREVESKVWLAAIKPKSEIVSHFGLQHEYFVVGNGYDQDFHQKTLKHEPPSSILDRIDPGIRFVASNAPVAGAFCAAWAQKNKSTILLLKAPNTKSPLLDQLYQTLRTSLWQRDYFAEAEPVRDPSEFFGREALVNELFSKILLGAPFAVFGLRKIGKSSLLGRLEDLVQQDESSISATAFLIGNSTRLKSGRWWHVAHDAIQLWQTKLQRFAADLNSKIHPKSDRLNDLISRNISDVHTLSTAFERDIHALLKSARALKNEGMRDAVRLVLFIDECDHLYPNIADSGHWRTDFFLLWNALQSIKRGLPDPEELVYVLGGVNPSGVEQGSLEGQPNPLYETQRTYLSPMAEPDATLLISGLSAKMGLFFDDDALKEMYRLVGGHPLLLRKLGSAIHENNLDRSARIKITSQEVLPAFNKKKRDLYNQVTWFLEHLARIAPDEEKMLRDISTGGSSAYLDFWENNSFRETYASHLEKYGLIKFNNQIPEVALDLIRDALRSPAASEFPEQNRELKELVESIEQAVRTRIKVDAERERTPAEAVQRVVLAIPSDAKTRAMSRDELTALGKLAGVASVLESLNWGDYEILLEKMYDEISWFGPEVPRVERLKFIKSTFKDAHLVRHNNEHVLKTLIASEGFSEICKRFSATRDMFVA